MNDPYDYNSWRYDQFGDVIVSDECDEYYADEECYDYTYADEVEGEYDGY